MLLTRIVRKTIITPLPCLIFVNYPGHLLLLLLMAILLLGCEVDYSLIASPSAFLSATTAVI